jgi:hypothetical protein
MSGLEVAEGVAGFISLAITVIEKSIQIYGAVKDKSGIPKELRKVSNTLPTLLELLKGAEVQFVKRQPTEQTWVEVEKDIKRCHEACQELHEILESAYPKADAGKLGRVCKIVGTVVFSHKNKTAGQVLKEIHEYLDILEQRQIITNAKLLEDIKKTVDELFPTTGITQNNVSGTNIGHNTGQVNNQTGGSGQQWNGDIGTFSFSK